MNRSAYAVMILLILITGILKGQNFNGDSAIAVVNALPLDSTRIIELRNLGMKLEEGDTLKAKQIYLQAIEESKKLKDPIQLCKSMHYLGNWNFNLSHYEEAEKIYRNAYEVALSANSKNDQAILYNSIGNTYLRRNVYDSALHYYIIAVDFFEKDKNYRRASLVSGNMCGLYGERSDHKNARLAGERAVNYALKSGDTTAIGRAYSNYGNALYLDTLYEQAIDAIKTGLPYLKAAGVKHFIQIAYTNISNCYFELGTYQESNVYADSCVSMAIELGSPINLANAYLMKGRTMIKLKNAAEAEKALISSYEYVEKDGSNFLYKTYYNDMAELRFLQGRFKEAYEMRFKRDEYNDKVKDEEMSDKMSELETIYENEKKQSEINKLESEHIAQAAVIKQKNTLNLLLIFGLVAVGVIAFLYFRNTQRKQQINQQNILYQEQEILRLQQERQLVATQSILKGEESERSRMARDLHDGLGSLLSGVKLSLSSMKGNQIINEEYAMLFSKSIDQLDNAIHEMRRVAHNMMPEALIKFGLAEAVNNFAESLNETGALKVHFESYGLDQRLSSDQEIVVYRIIQELVNNAVKHAACKNIIIQLSKNENIVNLEVEDDGKGFDATKINFAEGMGFRNLNNRVEYLRGKMNIKSESGKGTSVFIEFPVV